MYTISFQRFADTTTYVLGTYYDFKLAAKLAVALTGRVDVSRVDVLDVNGRPAAR